MKTFIIIFNMCAAIGISLLLLHLFRYEYVTRNDMNVGILQINTTYRIDRLTGKSCVFLDAKGNNYCDIKE